MKGNESEMSRIGAERTSVPVEWEWRLKRIEDSVCAAYRNIEGDFEIQRALYNKTMKAIGKALEALHNETVKDVSDNLGSALGEKRKQVVTLFRNAIAALCSQRLTLIEKIGRIRSGFEKGEAMSNLSALDAAVYSLDTYLFGLEEASSGIGRVVLDVAEAADEFCLVSQEKQGELAVARTPKGGIQEILARDDVEAAINDFLVSLRSVPDDFERAVKVFTRTSP